MVYQPVKAIIFDFVGVILRRRPDYQPEPLVEAVDAIIGHVVDDCQFKTTILQDYKLSEEEFERILQSVVDDLRKHWRGKYHAGFQSRSDNLFHV